MSPEQLRGEKLDFRSDVFSLGALMYEILSGQTLFPQREESRISEAILAGDFSLNAISLCKSLVPLVSCCLSFEPTHRFESAIELLRHFDAHVSN